MLLVGDPSRDWPIRLPIRMKTKSAEQRQELAALRAHVAFEHADDERRHPRARLQLAGLSTLSDERMARPMKRMKSVISPTKTMWSGTWIPSGAKRRLISATSGDGCSIASTGRHYAEFTRSSEIVGAGSWSPDQPAMSFIYRYLIDFSRRWSRTTAAKRPTPDRRGRGHGRFCRGAVVVRDDQHFVPSLTEDLERHQRDAGSSRRLRRSPSCRGICRGWSAPRNRARPIEAQAPLRSIARR